MHSLALVSSGTRDARSTQSHKLIVAISTNWKPNIHNLNSQHSGFAYILCHIFAFLTGWFPIMAMGFFYLLSTPPWKRYCPFFVLILPISPPSPPHVPWKCKPRRKTNISKKKVNLWHLRLDQPCIISSDMPPCHEYRHFGLFVNK